MLAHGAVADGAKDVADEVDGDGEHHLLLGRGVELGGDLGDGHAGEGGVQGRVDDEHAAVEHDHCFLFLIGEDCVR